jgi:putative ATP-dependent endonuclease of OLD family
VKDAKIIRSLPDSLPNSVLRRGSREGPVGLEYLRHFGSVGELSASASQRLDEVLRSGTESDDLRPAIRNLAVHLDQEAADLQRQELKNTITTFSGEETSVPGYVETLLESIDGIGVLYLQERRKPIGKEEAQRLLELKMSRGGPQVLRRIQETVDSMLGVQIDAFRGDSRNPRSESEAELDVDDFLVQANGSGIRESLRLILDNEFEHPSLLLIEEPEVHLHPALEASMMRYLQSISSVCQVFLTTHSTNFLDTAELTNVYLITKSDSTKAELLDIDAAETVLPRELGLRMSSLFMYDRLVFVEGRTDEAIIREWASLLRINLSQSNVGFVPMGGARNFSHYAASATLAFLSKRNVKSWILLDRDERDAPEIDRLKGIAGKFATVNVLEHREIENLLLQPRVILELVKFKLRAAGKPEGGVTQDQVEAALETALEALKKTTIHKRITKSLCVPLIPNHAVHDVGDNESTREKLLTELDRMISDVEATKARFDDTEKAKTDLVEANWALRKTQMVPGELAMDHILRSFGLRFNKDHDGPRMASMMRDDEIDPAMKAFIRDLGAN